MEKNIDLNAAIYVGVDTHRYTHTAVAANRFEEPLGELTFPNTPTGIQQFSDWMESISPVGSDRVIGIEGAGNYGRNLARAAGRISPTVLEVNPLLTKSRRRLTVGGDKTDAGDAGLIVEVLTRKANQLPPVTAVNQTPALVNLEELVDYHVDLVRESSRLKNQLHALFARENPGYRLNRGAAFSTRSLTKWLSYSVYRQDRRCRFPESSIRCQIIVGKVRQLRQIRAELVRLNKQIKRLLAETDSRLETLPGVGVTTHAQILTAVKGVARFPNGDAFVRYAGIAPIERSSGKTKKFVQNKAGNRKLNTAIYTVALTQLRCCPTAKVYFDKKVAEGKTKKHALRCLMKRVACIVYGMLKSNTPYRENPGHSPT